MTLDEFTQTSQKNKEGVNFLHNYSSIYTLVYENKYKNL